MLDAGYRKSEIARTIGVSKSTVTREVSRNADGRSGAYRHALAQRKAEERKRSKPHAVALTPEAKAYSCHGSLGCTPSPLITARNLPGTRALRKSWEFCFTLPCHTILEGEGLTRTPTDWSAGSFPRKPAWIPSLTSKFCGWNDC